MAPLQFLTASQLSEADKSRIVIVVDREAALPDVDPAACDAMISTVPNPPFPWVGIASARIETQIGAVNRAVTRAPIAASVLARLLRKAERVPFDTALEAESLAYSSLLGGSEFATWLVARKSSAALIDDAEVHYEREGDEVRLTLCDPATRNAITAAMRDALCEALENVIDDPSLPHVTLCGAGKCFSTGGFLPEFGTQRDLALAHEIRMARSPARLLHRLGERGQAALHGACIGSGIEIAAAAHRRTGRPGTFVQLPELAMGLIPGAGGTVSLPRAIGRHRTAWLALGGFRLKAQTALEWGLLHAIEP